MPGKAKVLIFTASALFSAAVGCTSIRSTIYRPDDQGGSTTKHLKGTPMTLDVVNHVKISIVEKRYLLKGDSGVIDQSKCMLTNNNKENSPYVATSITYDPVSIPELFTVDVKRPFSGTEDYEFDFKGQAITQLNAKAVDSTITDVAALVAQVISTAPTLASLGKGKSTAFGDGTGSSSTLIPITSVVAFEVFDLRDPAIHEHIQAFLEAYVNRCGTNCAAHPQNQDWMNGQTGANCAK